MNKFASLSFLIQWNVSKIYDNCDWKMFTFCLFLSFLSFFSQNFNSTFCHKFFQIFNLPHRTCSFFLRCSYPELWYTIDGKQHAVICFLYRHAVFLRYSSKLHSPAIWAQKLTKKKKIALIFFSHNFDHFLQTANRHRRSPPPLRTTTLLNESTFFLFFLQRFPLFWCMILCDARNEKRSHEEKRVTTTTEYFDEETAQRQHDHEEFLAFVFFSFFRWGLAQFSIHFRDHFSRCKKLSFGI